LASKDITGRKIIMSMSNRTATDIIKDSDLSLEEQKDFLDTLVKRSRFLTEPIIDLIEEDPDMVRAVYENFKAKRSAFQLKDDAALNRILEDEEKQLLEND